MTRTMVRTFNLCAICFIVLVVGAFMAPGICKAEGEIPVDIDVAPHVINLQSDVDIVTIHAAIAYGYVNLSSVLVQINNDLVGNPPIMFYDSRGELVARFGLSDIQYALIVDGEPNIVQLWGLTTEGNEFFGEGLIKKVVDIVPVGAGDR